MSLNYNFTGKRVLVTGGASGIGKQLVKRFCEGGATVYTIDIRAENLQKLKVEFPTVTTAVVDLSDWNSTRKVVESFGEIDHLVNNAGFVDLESALDVIEQSMLLTYQVLTAATLNVTQVVAKSMIKTCTGGSVVNISSISTKLTLPNITAYCAAKTAVEAVTKSLAVELGPQGVRVNCVAPGWVDTPLLKPDAGGTISGHLQIMEQRAVVKRLIDPDEIANVVLFLLSPLSSMIVGQTVRCDGGVF